MHRYINTLSSVAMAVAASANSRAGFTPTFPNASEPGPAEVLDRLYGGSFEQSGRDYTNGRMSAIRVDDDLDQFWDGSFVAQIVGRFSGYSQSFGRAVEGRYQELIAVAGVGFDTDDRPVDVVLANEPFLRSGNSGTQSSRPWGNRDGRDHMITYRVDKPGDPSWLLFWEDLNEGPAIMKGRSSSDLNDLVVLLHGEDWMQEQPAPVAVPLPSTFYAGLFGCGVAIYAARRMSGIGSRTRAA